MQGYGKKQGEYTAADRDAFPEECRTELIDGEIYDMPSPDGGHQIVVGGIYAQLLKQFEERDFDGMPFPAPFDVALDEDDRTRVQPDVLVVCDRDKIKEPYIWGAPDFAVEVISTFTAYKDCILKLCKYANAGVREYWIVDPEQELVMAYNLDRKNDDGTKARFSIHCFDETAPVGICDEGVAVDFARIRRTLDRARREGM